jgi:Tfp pilus assembly protein PilV
LARPSAGKRLSAQGFPSGTYVALSHLAGDLAGMVARRMTQMSERLLPGHISDARRSGEIPAHAGLSLIATFIAMIIFSVFLSTTFQKIQLLQTQSDQQLAMVGIQVDRALATMDATQVAPNSQLQSAPTESTPSTFGQPGH